VSSLRPRKKHLSYDKKAKRFRDARGRFIPSKQGMRSKYARIAYRAATGKLAKPKAVRARPPKPIKLLRPVKKIPSYLFSRVAGVKPPQYLVSGVGRWNVRTLATLLLKQLKGGYNRFRFWFKVRDTGYGSKGMIHKGSYIGSTKPMHYSIITENILFEEIVNFLLGSTGDILPESKVIYYWMRKGKL